MNGEGRRYPGTCFCYSKSILLIGFEKGIKDSVKTCISAAVLLMQVILVTGTSKKLDSGWVMSVHHLTLKMADGRFILVCLTWVLNTFFS